jgi:hypothetical protein
MSEGLIVSVYPWNSAGSTRRKGDREVGEEQLCFSGPDFRDTVDCSQCGCEVGKKCRLYCTENDVDALRASPFFKSIDCKVKRMIRGVLEYVVEMSIKLAIFLGLIDEDAVNNRSLILFA